MPPLHTASRRAASDARITAVSSSEVNATRSPARRMSIGAPAARRTAAASSAASRASGHGRRSMRACSTIARREVVDEGRTADLVGEIEPRQAPPHDAIIRRRLGCCRAARRSGKVDLAGHGPVVLADGAARAQEAAIVDGEGFERARQPVRDTAKEKRAHFGACEANGAARDGDRVAARGETLRRARRRLPRDDAQPLGRHVQLLGGNLRERGEHALADLDLAGRQPHAAALLEADPGREQRIVDRLFGSVVTDALPSRRLRAPPRA